MLKRVRWEKRQRESDLQRWAVSNGLGEWPVHELRRKKEEYDAIDRIKQGPDRETWLELQRLARDCLDLAVAFQKMKIDLIERNKFGQST